MATAAAARAFFSSPSPPPLLYAGHRTTIASFPQGWPPTIPPSLLVSAPASPWVPVANPKYHNTKVDAGDEDVDGGDILRRFTREVARSGVMHEVRRRRRHEDALDKRKRKSRDAAWRFRRRAGRMILYVSYVDCNLKPQCIYECTALHPFSYGQDLRLT